MLKRVHGILLYLKASCIIFRIYLGKNVFHGHVSYTILTLTKHQ
jgi:hypothetical protein